MTPPLVMTFLAVNRLRRAMRVSKKGEREKKRERKKRERERLHSHSVVSEASD